MKDYSKLPENQLISLAKAGDDKAMDFLLEQYKNFVKAKSHAYFLIGADKDDIIQEGMLGLFKAVRSYDEQKNSSFKSFAELCIKRQILTAIKTATRQKHSPLNTYISLNLPIYEDENERELIEKVSGYKTLNPEEILINEEQFLTTDKKIKKALSKFETIVFEMYVGGKTYIEIAEILEKEPKSIDNALQRIKKKILCVLKNENIG